MHVSIQKTRYARGRDQLQEKNVADSANADRYWTRSQFPIRRAHSIETEMM